MTQYVICCPTGRVFRSPWNRPLFFTRSGSWSNYRHARVFPDYKSAQAALNAMPLDYQILTLHEANRLLDVYEVMGS